MRDLFLWLTAMLATWVVLLSLTFVVLRWRLHRANRVSPAMKSPAPLVWLWSPTHPARLHRRLRLATAPIHLSPAHRSGTQPRTVEELQRELEYQAVELDYHVVLAARHPRTQRRPLLRQLDAQVTEVERLSVRLSALSRPAGSPTSGWSAGDPPEVLERISQQLDLLDEAHQELAEIERAAGLVDVDAILAPTTKSVASAMPPVTGVSSQTKRSTKPR